MKRPRKPITFTKSEQGLMLTRKIVLLEMQQAAIAQELERLRKELNEFVASAVGEGAPV